MKIHHLGVADALESLRSGALGLSSAEAARRFKEFGPNRVERLRPEGWGRRLLRGFTHLFAVILWVAASLAFFAEWQDPGQGMATLGGAIVAVIVINGLFSFWQEHRAEQALAALQRLLPHAVKVMRDGALVTRPALELVPGDVVLLEGGDDVPADCRLIEAFGARVNNATVTGESVPLPRDTAPSTTEDLLHSRNILLAGTSLVSGETKAVVFATGMHTEFGKIAHLTQAADVGLSPLQREIVRLTRVIALIATALGVIFFFIGQSLGLSFWGNLLFGIGIIVANVPEGLLPTVTLALAMGSQRMARRNVIIRHLPSVETLGCTTVIVSDKTGTLTQNRMDVRCLLLGGEPCEVVEASRLAQTYGRFFETALLCHGLKEAGHGAENRLLGDPMEIALLALARQALPGTLMLPRVDEIPFDSDRRRLSTVHESSTGRVLYTKGALESVLPLCREIQIGRERRSITDEYRRSLIETETKMAHGGLRVLAFAFREVGADETHEQLEQGLVLTGLVGLRDPPRPEAPAAVHKCREAGIKVIMVTGDHPETAAAIAREIGLVQSTAPRIITGERLRRLTEAELQLALDAPEILFARVGADQKLRIVRALKRKGEVVSATGDGVNDAPALKHADIGIAMGRTGTDVARESADMVLLDDNFASIVAAVEEGRAVYDNIRKFLTYILTSNVPEIVPYLAFVLFKIPLPLTIIQILAVDLGTDMLPALALGAEAPEREVMRRPPRPRTQRLLSAPLLLRAYAFLGLMEAAAAMAAFFFVLEGGGWEYGQMLAPDDPLYLLATTATLSAIIVMQVVNVFLCRSEHASAFAASRGRNRLILLGLAAEIGLILVIDYTGFGNHWFGTAPIAASVWLFVLPFAVAMLLAEELRKTVLRHTLRRVV